jgi:hypothetical protein
MKGILFPALLAAAGYLGVTQTDKIVDLYRAAYPNDPQKSLALERCATRNPNFNRLDSADRAYCYSDGYEVRPAAVGLGRGLSPSYDFNPSHLPKDDVRRQQANDTYTAPPVPPGLTTPAMAAPPPPQPMPPVTKPLPANAARPADPHQQPLQKHHASQPPPYQAR